MFGKWRYPVRLHLVCLPVTSPLGSSRLFRVPLLRSAPSSRHLHSACTAARAEKKSYSGRQVRRNFNLKLKAPRTACFQLGGPAKRESTREDGVRDEGRAAEEWETNRERVGGEKWEHKEPSRESLRNQRERVERREERSRKEGKTKCQPSSRERWVH